MMKPKSLILPVALALILIITICTYSASAMLEVTKNVDVKKGDKLDFNGKQVDYNSIWDKYKPIKIVDNWGIPFISSEKFEGYIDKHTFECGDSCSSTITIKQNDDKALIEDVRFYTIKKDGSKILEDINSYQFYIKTGENEKIVDDYANVCKESGNILPNGTREVKCKYEKTGNHKVIEDIWTKYNIGEVKPAGEYTIKLDGEKSQKRTVDWQIKSYDIWLEDWAVWNGTITTANLLAYYKFDEGTGTEINDSLGRYNTNYSTGQYWQVGKLNNSFRSDGLDTDGSQTYINLTGQQNMTVSFWLNKSGVETDGGIFTFDNCGEAGEFGIYMTTDRINVCTQAQNLNGWTPRASIWEHYVVTVNSTTIASYVNGVYNESMAVTNFKFATSAGKPGFFLFIGGGGAGSDLQNVSIDEMGIWNRTLTLSEIQSLYNSGNGLPYSSFSSSLGTVTLNSPANSSEFQDSSSINFNCSASIIGGDYIINMSLFDNSNGNWKINQTINMGYSLCYQETANMSNAKDGDCGLSYAGNYGDAGNGTWSKELSIKNLIDGDWATDDYTGNTGTCQILLINYTKPSDSLNTSLWQVKNSGVGQVRNLTITQSCWNYGSKLVLRAQSCAVGSPNKEYVEWECYNGVSWQTLFNTYSTCPSCSYGIYEEAMWWNTSVKKTSTSEIFTNKYNIGNYVWNCQACDNNGECGFANQNRSIKIIPFNNNTITQDYNPIAYETSENDFSLNVTYNTSLYNFNGYLVYNGISYSAIKTNIGSITIFSKKISIPSVTINNQNVSFYWVLNTTGYSYSTSPTIQTLKAINFSICDGILPSKLINFSIYDEQTNSPVNSAFNSFFYIWVGNGATKKNVSYSNNSLTSWNSYAFCSDYNLTLYSDSDISYTATNYLPREYHSNNMSLNNVTTNINLYLLNYTTGVKFYFKVLQGAGQTVTNANVQIDRFVVANGSYISNSVRETDDNGNFIEYLQQDAKYRFIITKNLALIGIAEKTATCTVSPCEITIQLNAINPNNVLDYYNSKYANNTISSLTFEPITKIVTYSFTDITGKANYFRLQVNKVMHNTTQNIICDTTSYTTSGTLTCNMTNVNGDFIAVGYLSRSPEVIDKTLNFFIDILKSIQTSSYMLLFFIGWLITITFAGLAVSRGNPSTTLMAFMIAWTSAKLMLFNPFGWIIVILVDILIYWGMNEIGS